MAFIHVKGPAKTEPFQKLASTAIAVGGVLAFTSGYVAPALTASTRIAGVNIKKVASGDSDFASATLIPVIIPGEEDVFEADVTGTATQANVGKQYDLSIVTAGGTAQNIDLSLTTYKVVTVVGFISASKVLVKFNGNYIYANKDN